MPELTIVRPALLDSAGSLAVRATAYAESIFADARRDDELSPAAHIEALDALQHSRRVGGMMDGLAQYFGADHEQFTAAGVLHDVGKVARDERGRRPILETISQPGGLSDDDRALVRWHGPLGAELISDEFDPHITAATARHCDYAAEELTFMELALQACDVYDALRSPRVYKDGHRHARAMVELIAQAPALPEELVLFFALHGDAMWHEVWDVAPGCYGDDPIQLVAGLAA